MPKPVPRPYPIAPLAAADHSTLTQLADRLGLSPNARHHLYRHNGMLSEHQADTYACRLGLHPYTVWGQLWLDNCPDSEPGNSHKAS